MNARQLKNKNKQNEDFNRSEAKAVADLKRKQKEAVADVENVRKRIFNLA